MKKLALFAMLLASGLLYGCGEKPVEKKPPATTPAAGEADKKNGETTPPAKDETKPADKKPATPPVEPAK